VAAILLGLAVGASVLDPPLATAGTLEAQARVSKHKSGPYGSFVRGNLDAGEKRLLYLKAKNTASVQQNLGWLELIDVNLDATWFKGFTGHNNITAAIDADTYVFNVQSGKVRFRVKVKALASGVEGCVTAQIHDSSNGVNANIGVNSDVCGA
jgi:hypothetical protein